MWLGWMIPLQGVQKLSSTYQSFLYFSFLFHFGFLLFPTYFITGPFLNKLHNVSAAEMFCSVNDWNQTDQKTLKRKKK